MEKKIDTSMYDDEFNKIFGTTPITFSELSYVINEIKEIRKKAFNLFKERKFYDSACFYKALLDHVLAYLSHVDDKNGKLSEVVFEFIRYFSTSCRNSNEIDKIDFFQQALNLYLKEDLGFADEISCMIVDNIKNNEERNYLEKFILKKIKSGQLKIYNQNKLVELLLRIYRKFNVFDKYIETCSLLSIDRWERYIYPSEIYESLGELENALKMLEDGMKNLPEHKKLFEKRYDGLKKRILGL